MWLLRVAAREAERVLEPRGPWQEVHTLLWQQPVGQVLPPHVERGVQRAEAAALWLASVRRFATLLHVLKPRDERVEVDVKTWHALPLEVARFQFLHEAFQRL